jgi:hypothetical protein
MTILQPMLAFQWEFLDFKQFTAEVGTRKRGERRDGNEFGCQPQQSLASSFSGLSI